MTVQLTKRRGTPAIDRRKLARRAQRLLVLLNMPDCELSVLLTGDDEMRALNRSYRGLDRTTDVLSFSQREGEGAAGQVHLLGDVVISLAQTQRQAGRRGIDTWAELLELLVHGVLHLLGYDHLGDRKRALLMRREQAHLTEMLLRLDSK